MEQLILVKRQRDAYSSKMEEARRWVVYDIKWQKFLRRAWLFRYIPFIDFVFGSGSMALGNVTETSDFDVLVGARKGRIFTARFFAAIAFSLFGWRRSRADHRESAADKVCLNHFVTPSSFSLSVPPNEYWKRLYGSLVPLYGKRELMKQFFGVNKSWLGSGYQKDLRHRYETASALKRAIEKILSGWLGNWFEQKVKRAQVRRIERSIKAGAGKSGSHIIKLGRGAVLQTLNLPPLMRFDDSELQFHPDPVVIEIQ